ncbi:hypothetical protein INT46_009073 [Mucor plumbeus]|uniref:OTU domain-containing protein n=1 Tax=Mucor plumbeus TaxID=97098 RepID=A0A8H7QRJ2_9FUNG|nr:hypothetical protein INT46_009073 [Mucor plumbeus]
MAPKYIHSHNEDSVYDPSETKSTVTWFKNQFPDGFVIESSSAHYDSLLRKHTYFDLNIGWQLETLKSKIMKDNNKTLYKRCLGSVVCRNILSNGKQCTAFDIDVRPKSTEKLIKHQMCHMCNKPMTRKTCNIKVTFTLRNYICFAKNAGFHSHKAYNQKHLTILEGTKLNEIVKSNKNITPKEAMDGISSKTGKIHTPVTESVSNLLGTIDRTKYVLGTSRQRRGVPTREAFNSHYKSIDAYCYLKGCYMHWMQSVQRIVSNYNVVPLATRKNFLRLVSTLRRSTDVSEFNETIATLKETYPNCLRWLKWWLQPSVSSMIFRSVSKQNERLLNYDTRTSNAVEAYHRVLYRVIQCNQSVDIALEYILQYCKTDGNSFVEFVEKGILYYYGSAQKKKRVKKSKFLYDLSDSRAPDNNRAIFILDENHKADLDSSSLVNSKTKDIDPEIINLVNRTIEDAQENGLDEVEAFFKTIDETNLLNDMVAEKKTRQFLEQFVKIKASNKDESLELYEKLSSTILKALGEIEDLEKKVSKNKNIVLDKVSIKSEQQEATVKTAERNIAPAAEKSKPQRGTKRKLSDGMVEVASKKISLKEFGKLSILDEEKMYGICRDPTKFFKGSKLHNLAKLHSSILPYYRDIVDMKGDGNCGYRVLSYQLYDGNQSEYLRVKTLMKNFFFENINIYFLLRSFFDVKRCASILESNEGITQWFNAPECAQLAACTFSRPIAVYDDNNNAITFLPFIKNLVPNTANKQGKRSKVPLLMQNINRNHWITVDLKRRVQVRWPLINGHHNDCLQMILADESIDPSLIHVDTSFWRDNISHYN